MSGPTLAQPTPDMNREQLRNKLVELQAKKARMDDMLQELHILREDPFLLLNNGKMLHNMSLEILQDLKKKKKKNVKKRID